MKKHQPYCDRMRRYFDEYHDEELSAFLSKLVDKHMDKCTPCKKDYLLLQMAIETIRQKQSPEIPVYVLRKVISALTEDNSGGKKVPEELQGNEQLGYEF